MTRRFSSEELYAVRNLIPLRLVISELLGMPGKEVEGIYRFVCPCCHESQTAINSRTNLSRCFRCERNFTSIELVMLDRMASFVEAVKILQRYLPSQAASAINSCS